METIQLKRDCEAIAIPSGQRQVLPQGTAVRIVQARGESYTISTPIHALYRIDGRDADALGLEQAKPVNEPTQQKTLSEKLVLDTLRTVYDPELPVNIVDLGLVYSCTIVPDASGANEVVIRMSVTAPGCGMSNVLKSDVETKVQRLPGVQKVRVDVVFDPPWNPSRMSEAARLQLGMDFGDQPKLVQIE